MLAYLILLSRATLLKWEHSTVWKNPTGYLPRMGKGNPLLWDQVVTNLPHAPSCKSCNAEDEIANKTVKFDRFVWTNAGLADGSVTTAYTATHDHWN